MAGGSVQQWALSARGHAQAKSLPGMMQLLTTVVPLIGLWAAMVFTVDEAVWATLLLAIPAAAFVVRLFIIQHDCGHDSFFPSRRLNNLLGRLIGIVTLTPHDYWRRAHNIHHSTCGNLRERGIGDISLLTVAEYTALSGLQRLLYRIYRHPIVMFGIGPVYLFVIKNRFPLDLIRRDPKLLINVMVTNLCIAGALTVLGLSLGFAELLIIQGPVILLSGAAGVWLFYVQHQFEHTYWRGKEEWDFHEAAVRGSSYYDLPQPLRWFTADIGIHHIHHLSSRIPNYRLKACLAEIPALQTFNRIGLRDSLSCLRLALWDEGAQRLISFKALRGKEIALPFRK